MNLSEIIKLIGTSVWLYLKAIFRFLFSDKFKEMLQIVSKNSSDLIHELHNKIGDEGMMLLLTFSILFVLIIWAFCF